MSTLAEWAALYDEWRDRYPWLPGALFEPTTANLGGLFVGPNKFLVRLDQPANRNVIAHEAGHFAHLVAATRRDSVEGRGTAGDDIIREVQQIVAPGRDWLEPPDPLRSEYVAEAFRKASTGLTGPMGYPNPTGERSPYPVNELLTYFRTMTEPRLAEKSEVAMPIADTFIASEEFTAGRPWGPPLYIVDHWTVGTANSAVRRFTDSVPDASAHFVVTRDGAIIQLVELADTAWHSGTELYNYRGIGIEHEHYDEDPSNPGLQQDWPEVQLEASGRLHKALSEKFGIPLVHSYGVGSGVLGHGETGYATACPGDFPIDTVLAMARGEEEPMTPERYAVELEDLVKATVRVIVDAEYLERIKADAVKAVADKLSK